MVAYNLMSLLRHFALNHHNQATLSTLRPYCFAIGGWMSQHARKRSLKLSLPPPKKTSFDGLHLPKNRRSSPTIFVSCCIIRVQNRCW